MTSAPAQPASRVRYGVVAFAVLLAIITYVDRVCISQAAPLMRAELGLSAIQMGWAFTAFAWANALFEIPGGMIGDRWGARRSLTRVVLWWSFFTAATGWVTGFSSLLIMRSLFGAGEAGCFPNIARAFAAWLPPLQRMRAQGILWLSARWGGAFTPLLVALMLQYVSWRRCFEIFGVLGVIWAVFFFRWFRDRPADHPRVNPGERAMLAGSAPPVAHGPVPWRLFFRSRAVWLLWGQYICINYGWAFYVTWLPTYLREARGLSLQSGALLAGLPLFFGGIGSFVSGLLGAPLAAWLGDTMRARRVLSAFGCAGAGVALVVSLRLHSPVAAMVAMGMASFCNDLAMPPAWVTCMDVGGRHAGTLSGSMNMMGNLSVGVASLSVGYLLEISGRNWALPFYLGAAMYFLGAVCWWMMGPARPLEEAA